MELNDAQSALVTRLYLSALLPLLVGVLELTIVASARLPKLDRIWVAVFLWLPALLVAGYLLREELPGWMRVFCTRVLNLAAVGQLDPREFGVERSRPGKRIRHEQRFAPLLTLGGFLVYLLFLA